MSRYGLADLHIHSNYSDGVSSIPKILDHVEKRTKLSVIAITDHNTIKGSLHAASLQDRYSFDVVVGEEISTTSGEIIGLFLEKEIEAGLHPEEVVQRVHEQGGLAIAPHPFAVPVKTIGGFGVGYKQATSLELDGFEELNSSPTSGYSNFLSKRLLRPLGLSRLGGSDAHTVHCVGAAATQFEGESAADLRRSIEEGKTFPVKISSWFKQLALTAFEAPKMAKQADRCRKGIALRDAIAASEKRILAIESERA